MSIIDGNTKNNKNYYSLDFVGNNKNIDEKPKKKIIFYHFYILRIISSFAVVLIHISAEYYKSKINSFDFKISFFYNGIARFGVPIFYMISGALFLKQDISFNKIYNKYIKRMLIHLS